MNIQIKVCYLSFLSKMRIVLDGIYCIEPLKFIFVYLSYICAVTHPCIIWELKENNSDSYSQKLPHGLSFIHACKKSIHDELRMTCFITRGHILRRMRWIEKWIGKTYKKHDIVWHPISDLLGHKPKVAVNNNAHSRETSGFQTGPKGLALAVVYFIFSFGHCTLWAIVLLFGRK